MTSALNLAVLGLLTEQDLHGYELKKRLGDVLGSRVSVSFGSLYPALARLEKQGAVKAVEERRSPSRAPMSGSLAGELAAFRSRMRESGLTPGARGKKVYGITDVGRQQLLDALTARDVDDDRTFALRVAFAGHLAPAERLDLFERRRAVLIARRGDHTRADRRGGPLDAYRRALIEREAASIDSDVSWLEGLIARERATLQEETS